MIDILEAKRKKKNKINITYTTGDPELNIKHFNRMLGNDLNNPSTEEAKAAKAAAKAINKELGVTQTPVVVPGDIGEIMGGTNQGGTDFIGNESSDAGEAAGSGEAGGEGMGESLKLHEAKREVRRYFIRPQHIFCANKAEIIKALIDVGEENCSVYTLKYLGDEKDINKLTTKDIIYYYDDGILYDKNHVKVMDYDLYIKHEEERKKFPGDADSVSKDTFDQEYEDRITHRTELEEDIKNPFELDFPNINAFGEDIDSEVRTCCICGEEFVGYGNNPEPVKSSGRCCDACNLKFVIPARMEMTRAEED